jgi:rubredoxin
MSYTTNWSIGNVALVAALVGGLAAGLGVTVFAMLVPKKCCPRCGFQLPRFRSPANRQQALQGGYTCRECGAELDRFGVVLPGG